MYPLKLGPNGFLLCVCFGSLIPPFLHPTVFYVLRKNEAESNFSLEKILLLLLKSSDYNLKVGGGENWILLFTRFSHLHFS